MKLLLIYLTLFTHLFAYDTFILKSSVKNFNSAPYTSYIQDVNNSLNPQYILAHDDLKQLQKNGQLPNLQGPFWSRLEIKNETGYIQHLIFNNILPAVNYIDVYIYKNNILVKKHLLGDMREQSTKELLGRYSMFTLSIEEDETFTIVSKVDNYNIMNLSWIISQSNYFMNEESKTLIFYGLIGGFFLLFSILSFILYTLHKTSSYLVMGIYSFSSIFYILTYQGVLYNLDVGINITLLTLTAWIAPSVNSIMFLIFTYKYFSIKQRYKKFYYLMIGLIIIHISLILITSYAVLVDGTYIKYSLFIGISIIMNAIYLISVGIYMKEVGSKFYLFGQMILIFAVIFTTLSIFGIITYHDIYRHLINVAILIDLIFLLIAQSLKTKHNINFLSNSKIALTEYSRFNSIGLAINNISHQWRHPLTHVGMSLTLIEAVIKNKKETEAVRYINDELPKVVKSIDIMKKTLDEFTGYYSQDILKKNFSPKESVKHVIHIFNSKVLLKKATINLDIPNDLRTYNYEHIFSNIIMILIDNSLDEFTTKSKENNISISMHKDNLMNMYILTYNDNAGGIKLKPIEDVFKYFVTTKKDDNQVHGTGLAMVKMLIEERCHGQISIKNTKNGVEFKILLPID